MIQGIALRTLPHTPKLYADYWDAKDGIRAMIPRYFREPNAFAEQAKLIDARTYDRRSLCGVLREQNERFGSGPQTLANIARLEDPKAVVAIGGQQAGLFGGPLYTAFKALTILALARKAESTLGRPVVPVFWIASEDSDLAEVDHTYVTDREGKLRTLHMPGAGQAKIPVSRIQLGEPIGPLLDELQTYLPEGDGTREVMAELRAAYTTGRTYPQAFGAWMAHLFGPLGLALVDPSEPRLKRMAQPLFDTEITDKSPVSTAVIEQTALLKKAGYDPQIDVRDGFLTLFHQDPARDAITMTPRGFELKASGRKFTPKELSGLLADSPDSFTPNAVMRPLFQDTIFPSLAVVLGPSEIAYWCQLTLAYQRLNIPMPLLVPRSSVTLVEKKIDRLREKLGVDFVQVLQRGEHIIDDILRRKVPESLTRRMADSRKHVSEAWDGIVSEIDALDPTLHRTVEIAKARTTHQLDFIDRKIAQAARKKDGILRGQVERLTASLAPRGGLQERSLCIVPFLASYGSRIISQAAEGIDPFAPEHRTLAVE
jgi:bacillithiol biosynthesis cysteine-adding enzyme BshC